jgi:Right handed beta helix region
MGQTCGQRAFGGAVAVVAMVTVIIWVSGGGAYGAVSLAENRIQSHKLGDAGSDSYEVAKAMSKGLARCPAASVKIRPTANVQRRIDSKTPGTRFCFHPGMYRVTQPIRPRSGDQLLFLRGAVLSGARVVDSWSRQGTLWVASGQTQSFRPYAVPCSMNPPACEYEDLFRDGAPMTRVLSLDGLGPGSFFFDEAKDHIYISEDPSEHLFEAPVAPVAIKAPGVSRVSIIGATIQMFGRNGLEADGRWVVKRNVIRYVHSHGLRVFGQVKVRRNVISYSGNMGIFGKGDGLVFAGNELSHNNYLRFGKSLTEMWHAGAAKITESTNTVVRNNHSHDNFGDGWWFDTDNWGVDVRGNVFENNSRYGVLYESSHKGHLGQNIFRRNGTSVKWGGAGLWLSTSQDVRVVDNLFDRNAEWALALSWTDRGVSSKYGEHRLANVLVRNNRFRLESGRIGVPYGIDRIYSSNNRFEGNKYKVADLKGQYWRWLTTEHDWASWQSLGQDDGGSVLQLGN